MGDGHQKIEVLLVVWFLGTPGTEHEKSKWQVAGDLAGDRHEQFDAAIDEQRTFLDRKLMPHPGGVTE